MLEKVLELLGDVSSGIQGGRGGARGAAGDCGELVGVCGNIMHIVQAATRV